MTRFAVIIPAAGSSARFGVAGNKLLQPLGNMPVIQRAIAAFARRADVTSVVLPVQEPEQIRAALDNMAADARIRLCLGGATRAHSVGSAVRTLADDVEWVAVHDAARPLVSQDLIDRAWAAAQEHGAAVPAMPVHLTIKQAAGPLPARVERTVPREQLWAMQTPQIMRLDWLREAFERCPLPLEQITDDAQLLELAGRQVWLVAGDERNIKITSPQDLRIAELLLAET